MYTIHYQRFNAVTRTWGNHQVSIDSDKELTIELLRMAWQVTQGELIITRVGKVL